MAKYSEVKLNDGNSVPLMAFGTGSALMKQADDGKVDRERVEQIKTAIQIGFRHLDAAEAYFTEREIGCAIKESGVPRGQFFLAFKCLGFSPIAQTLETSLAKLGTDYVDLCMLHMPWIEEVKSLPSAWAELEAVKAAGKAKSIGVSNFSIEHLEKIMNGANVPPAVNQLELSVYLQCTELRLFMEKHSLTAEAYALLSPVTVAKGGPVDNLLSELAAKYEVSTADICIRWALEKKIVAVTTSSNQERLGGFLHIANLSLDASDVEKLDKAGSQKTFRKYFTERYNPGE